MNFRIPEFIDKWKRVELSTEPADRPRAEAAIKGLYALAKLREPKIFWLPCPLSAGVSATCHALMVAKRQLSEGRGEPSEDKVISSVLSSLDPALGAAVHAALASSVRSAPASVMSMTVRLAVLAAVYSAVNHAVHAAVDPAEDTALRSAMRAAVVPSLIPIVDLAIRPAIYVPAPQAAERAVRAAKRSYFAGSLRAQECAWADYFNRALGVAFDRSFLDLAESCGYCWMLDGVCFAGERPTRISLARDANGRLHDEAGPSVVYPSGWGLWHWHGVRVPQAVIERPETIAVEAIDRESNTEIRRVMIERYRHGAELQGAAAYLRDAGAERLDHDEAYGTLWRRAMPRDEPIVMVEVINATGEPDGGFRHYFLRVPPDTKTAREAVAWSFGFSGRDYAPEIET